MKNPPFDTFPANWKQGFQNGDIVIACNGKEIPVYDRVKGWTLLCWDNVEQRHLVYYFRSDMFDVE